MQYYRKLFLWPEIEKNLAMGIVPENASLRQQYKRYIVFIYFTPVIGIKSSLK